MDSHHNKSNEELQTQLQNKILGQYKDEQSFINYMLETKRNFLYRFLETSTHQDLNVDFLNNEFIAQSYEPNMGEAFKISDKEIKEGIKHLAKSVDRANHPKVRYQLKTKVINLNPNKGHIVIEACVNWGFPEFNSSAENSKKIVVNFHFADATIFRKELAIHYEKACELFV